MLSHSEVENESKAIDHTWISAITKYLRIVAVVQKILDVSQLMVNGYKIFVRYVCAHFDSVNMKAVNLMFRFVIICKLI